MQNIFSCVNFNSLSARMRTPAEILYGCMKPFQIAYTAYIMGIDKQLWTPDMD